MYVSCRRLVNHSLAKKASLSRGAVPVSCVSERTHTSAAVLSAVLKVLSIKLRLSTELCVLFQKDLCSSIVESGLIFANSSVVYFALGGGLRTFGGIGGLGGFRLFGIRILVGFVVSLAAHIIQGYTVPKFKR